MILGTVQFGLNYGISNKIGMPTLKQTRDILNTALVNGFTKLDTAFSYGDSEKVIGKLVNNEFEIISKLPDMLKYPSYTNNILNIFQTSLNNTRQNILHAYLLHNIENLGQYGNVLWDQMIKLKDSGLTKKIGYSLYSPKQLDNYFLKYKPDIVQIPMNILDREFQKTGWLSRLKDLGIEIHVRSVFLQGLLLMDYDSQLLRFPEYKNLWIDLKQELIINKITPLEYCLGFIKEIEEVDEIIIGVNSVNELEEITIHQENIEISYVDFSISDEQLIYPSNWKT